MNNMSHEDTITIKEYLLELRSSIKDAHDTTQKVLEQATKTNGRVNTLDSAVEKITAIIENHDRLLVMDEGRTKTRDVVWKVCMWSIPFVISGLGYFGYLYVEHIKQEVIVETSAQIITLIDKKYDTTINK